MRHVMALLAAWILVLVGPASAEPFSANYVFGDSLSDTGNLHVLTSSLHAGDPNIPVTPAAPYWNGRFSNGKTYVERFSEALGLSAKPSLQGGTNYAYGGARTSYHSLSALSPVASFDAQIASYLQGFPKSDPNALYTVFIGSNDAFDIVNVAAAGNTSGAASMMQAAVTSIMNGVTALVASGAMQFVIPTIPDIGLTPLILGQNSAALSSLATSVAIQLNAAISDFIDQLEATDPSLTIWRPDFFSLLRDANAHPDQYGLSDVTHACYSGSETGSPGTVCANPDQLLFWDRIHPTAAGHEVMADAVLAAIPEPQTYLLLLAGLAAIWGLRLGQGWSRQKPKLVNTSGAA